MTLGTCHRLGNWFVLSATDSYFRRLIRG